MKLGQALDIGEAMRLQMVKELAVSPVDGNKTNVSFGMGSGFSIAIKTPKADLAEQEFQWLQAFAEKLEAQKTGSTTVKSAFEVMTCQGFPAVEIEVKAHNLMDLCQALNKVLSPQNQIDTSAFATPAAGRA